MFGNSKHIWIRDHHCNTYVMFRKIINTVEKNVKVNIFAEGRYQLFVNGAFIGYGPGRYEPDYKEYDHYTIPEGILNEGNNCIAVLVNYIGRDTFQYICDQPGLIAEVLFDDKLCGTDSRWKAKKAEQWLPSTKMNIQLGFSEIYDKSKEPQEWKLVHYDDSEWEHAVELERNHSYYPRSIPHLRENERIKPIFVEYGNTTDTYDVYDFECGDLYDLSDRVTKNSVVHFNTYIYSPLDQMCKVIIHIDKGSLIYINDEKIDVGIQEHKAIELHLNCGYNLLSGKIALREFWQASIAFHQKDNLYISSTQSQPDGMFNVSGPDDTENKWRKAVSNSNIAQIVAWEKNQRASSTGQLPIWLSGANYLLLDFGKVILGRVQMEIDAPKDAVIDLAYGENLTDGRINPIKGNTWYADRYIATQGIQKFQTFDARGFRYLQLVIRTKHPSDRVKFIDVSARSMTYPVENKGEFSCSDDRLNEIWEEGKYTVTMCMEDAYIDCPWRERAQWWADARVMFLINLATFGDFSLIRRGLCQIGRGQDDDGLVPCVYPNRFCGVRLRDFNLVWISTIWDYYIHSNDESILTELVPRIKKVLNYFIVRLKDGLVTTECENSLIDWGNMGETGKIIALNAFLYKALQDTIQILKVLNDERDIKRLKELSEKVKNSLNSRFWCGQYYGDPDQALMPFAKSIVPANVLMIAYHIAPQKRWKPMMEQIQKQLNETLDNNGKSKVTGYFMHYVFEALEKMDEFDFAIRYIKEWWGWFIDRGFTTFHHGHGTSASMCHGWSASPTLFLSKNVLGVSYNTNSICIKPSFDQLNWAKGKYPVYDKGILDISWTKEKFIKLSITLSNVYEVDIKMPKGYKMVEIIADNKVHKLDCVCFTVKAQKIHVNILKG